MIQKLKLNFWQILGIILLLVGVAFVIKRETGVTPAAPMNPVAPPSDVLPTATMPSGSVAVPTH